MVAAHRISAFPSSARIEAPRVRGNKGRVEAAQRGVISGDGPNGGINGNTKSVILYGLPGKMTVEALTYFLKSYKLADPTPDMKEIIKMELYVLVHSCCSPTRSNILSLGQLVSRHSLQDSW